MLCSAASEQHAQVLTLLLSTAAADDSHECCLSAQGLRDVTKEEGALLCFDEVMTGFRIAKGGAQACF